MMFGRSKDTDHAMDGDGVETQSSGVSCSICLDSVFDNGDRSSAKLQCGHEFHLDCIGSAFNMKGEMQCPNCRKVEKGRWLYANGSTRIVPEYSVDEWNSEEEPYDIAFPELPFRMHWCPFGGITRFRSSFEVVESPSVSYHDQHHIFGEHTAGSSVTHSYITYLGHAPSPSFNSSDSVEFNDSGFNHNWNGLSGQNDVTSLRDFSPLDLRHTRSRRSPPTSSRVNGADQASNAPTTLRSTRGESDSITRLGTFAHPFILGHGSGPRAGSSFVPSIVPHHHGSNVSSHERTQLPHVIHHHQQPSTSPGMPSLIVPSARRYNSLRGRPHVVPATSHSDHSGGFLVFPPPSSSGRNLHEAENPFPIHTHPLERDYISHFPASSFDRDSGWGSHHQATGGSDSDSRTGNIWQRQWS